MGTELLVTIIINPWCGSKSLETLKEVLWGARIGAGTPKPKHGDAVSRGIEECRGCANGWFEFQTDVVWNTNTQQEWVWVLNNV